MFKFSFSNGDNVDNNTESASSPSQDDEMKWKPAEIVCVSEKHVTQISNIKETAMCYDSEGLSIKYVPLNSALRYIREETDGSDGVILAEGIHSDLIPAKYEGGLKIWECTFDLLEWLMNNLKLELEGKTVLDLGCGAGLLGIAALLKGANVIFQDYNKEVLEATTIPNVLMNLSEECWEYLMSNNPQNWRCKFVAGDWSSFTDLLAEKNDDSKYFDYIFTSETIYNPENHGKVCSVFKNCLKKTGTVFLGAKTYYFGVGGGLRQFESALISDGNMTSEVCWKCSSGVQREILQINFAEK